MGARSWSWASTVWSTREPGGTPIGEAVRPILLHSADLDARVPEADALLFSAARAQQVAEVIAARAQAGRVVVCDRSADSTLAYQRYGRCGLVGSRLGPAAPSRAPRELGEPGAVPAGRPGTLLIDLPVEHGLGRKLGDEITRFEERLDVAFHERVRDGFRESAAPSRTAGSSSTAAWTRRHRRRSPGRDPGRLRAVGSRRRGCAPRSRRPRTISRGVNRNAFRCE